MADLINFTINGKGYKYFEWEPVKVSDMLQLAGVQPVNDYNLILLPPEDCTGTVVFLANETMVVDDGGKYVTERTRSN